MRPIDEIYWTRPYLDTRRILQKLGDMGEKVSRKHVGSLFSAPPTYIEIISNIPMPISRIRKFFLTVPNLSLTPVLPWYRTTFHLLAGLNAR
jgi:hypothetical protein